jgi:hypothetical protein
LKGDANSSNAINSDELLWLTRLLLPGGRLILPFVTNSQRSRPFEWEKFLQEHPILETVKIARFMMESLGWPWSYGYVERGGQFRPGMSGFVDIRSFFSSPTLFVFTKPSDAPLATPLRLDVATLGVSSDDAPRDVQADVTGTELTTRAESGLMPVKPAKVSDEMEEKFRAIAKTGAST